MYTSSRFLLLLEVVALETYIVGGTSLRRNASHALYQASVTTQPILICEFRDY